jgi:hypothetical protein
MYCKKKAKIDKNKIKLVFIHSFCENILAQLGVGCFVYYIPHNNIKIIMI